LRGWARAAIARVWLYQAVVQTAVALSIARVDRERPAAPGQRRGAAADDHRMVEATFAIWVVSGSQVTNT
jgi:hypothetical protein